MILIQAEVLALKALWQEAKNRGETLYFLERLLTSVGVRENGPVPTLLMWPNRETRRLSIGKQVFLDGEGTERRTPFWGPSP